MDKRFLEKQAAHVMRVGPAGAIVKWRGALTVDPGELRRAMRDGWHVDGIEGWDVRADEKSGRVLLLPEPNLVVNSGINISLDRLFAIGGPPTQVRSMGVDDGSSNPSSGTSSSSAGSTNRRIVLFDSTPTRASQVVTCLGTFTQANVAFTMKRLFLSKAAAGTTDAVNDLYAMTNVFTMDMSGFTTWSQTFTAEVTGTGS